MRIDWALGNLMWGRRRLVIEENRKERPENGGVGWGTWNE